MPRMRHSTALLPQDNFTMTILRKTNKRPVVRWSVIDRTRMLDSPHVDIFDVVSVRCGPLFVVVIIEFSRVHRRHASWIRGMIR